MAYVFLLLAISSDVTASSLLKSTVGFTRVWPTAAVLTGYVLSLVFLSLAVKSIPIGVAYAMWSGLGTAAVVTIGIVLLGEGVSVTKIAGVALVIGGVVLLNLGGAH
jgi:small multidrug resistance pump